MANIEYENEFYAAQLKDKEELKGVSSGGVFWALAQSIIAEGGVVYGAEQQSIDQIVHSRAESLEEVKKQRRSKYLQSETVSSYIEARKDLIAGRKVLFSGTGCQIAGLYLFLGREYDNLCTCEVICHGVPCGLAWRSYKREKESRVGKKMVGLIYRNKDKGWSNNQYKITYSDGTEEFERSGNQLFHAGYLKGLFYRPSCGNCYFSKMPRVGDLTLADYWKYEGDLLKYGDKGISLVVVNNNKGKKMFDASATYMHIEETRSEDAIRSCKHLSHTPNEDESRAEFMEYLRKRGYYKAAKKYILHMHGVGIWSRIKAKFGNTEK